MQALFMSTCIVALAEMGDKTQLLSLLIAARFGKGKVWAIIMGVLLATLFNHFFAAAVGQWVIAQIGENAMRWVLATVFILMAVWVMNPDKLDKADTPDFMKNSGVFTITFLTFFLAEMGDKTQIATIALSASYDSLVMVVLGTTLGMMIANVPAILLGDKVVKKIPPKLIHGITAAIFSCMAVVTLIY